MTGTACRNLLLEERHHTAPAAQYVAEPDGHKRHAVRRAASCTISSATRLVVPITLLGFTALSVETSTK